MGVRCSRFEGNFLKVAVGLVKIWSNEEKSFELKAFVYNCDKNWFKRRLSQKDLGKRRCQRSLTEPIEHVGTNLLESADI